MAKEYTIDLIGRVSQDQDGSYRVEVSLTGIGSKELASKIALWARDSLKKNVTKIGRLDAQASTETREP